MVYYTTGVLPLQYLQMYKFRYNNHHTCDMPLQVFVRWKLYSAKSIFMNNYWKEGAFMDTELNYALIGTRLRAVRLKRGFTQEYVAEHAGISAQH